MVYDNLWRRVVVLEMTRIGCRHGIARACRVIVDGTPIRLQLIVTAVDIIMLSLVTLAARLLPRDIIGSTECLLYDIIV